MRARDALRRAERTLLDEGADLDAALLLALARLPHDAVPSLAALAHEVRLERRGPAVEIEGILSAKTAGCPEDCHFCSQSARWASVVRPVAPLNLDEIVAAARETARLGASEFCIVAAVRGPDEALLGRVLEAIPVIREQTGVSVAASLGILEADQARRLADGGLHRYNHNLETARSFFGAIVTTHTWEERRATCELVRDAGMELCCGAILGMGETVEQRIELLGDLRAVGPDEVPVNFLNPRPGTPLEERGLMEPLEAVRWIALFRLALPDAILRYAGGREVTMRELQALGLTAGINALVIGNYLTTLGRNPQEDLQMLRDLRMPIGSLARVM